MKIDWSVVKKTHIFKACKKYVSDNKKKTARNTFLVIGKNKYPAKFIRGLSYQISTGSALNPNVDYSGGKETIRFFSKLGFDTEYKGKIIIGEQTDINKKSLNQLKQKKILMSLIKQHFGNVETEVGFNWLLVPKEQDMNPAIKKVANSLAEYRGFKNYSSPGKSLKCDFFVPAINTIIEYDERQHFSLPRSISLSKYPRNISFGFDKKEWQSKSKLINAKDSDPEYRDEQRAFYDSLRDILSAKNNIRLLRIRYGEKDWESSNKDELIEILAHLSLLKKQLRIGRIILDFNESMSEFRKKPWNCRLKIISKQFSINPKKYIDRIKEIIQICHGKNCDIIVFPACSFVYRSNHEIRKYLKECKRIPLVISGFLKEGTEDDEAKLLLFGNIYDEFPISETRDFKIGNFSSICAISTTIKELYKKSFKQEIIEKNIIDKNSLLLFKLGHQQYPSGREKSHLEKVIRESNQLTQKRTAVFVTYWKYKNSKALYDFYEPKESWLKFDHNKDRIESLQNDFSDFIDIFDVKIN